MNTLQIDSTITSETVPPTHTLTDSQTHNVVSPSPSLSLSLSPPPLLDEIATTLKKFVVLPDHAAETLALWTLHTYAFHLRDVSTYLGIESPEKRCGKTTLLTILSELCNRAIVASNISSPAFFRVIEETRPTLLIDEADTFLQGNDELRGILNSGYTKKTAHVIRVINQPANSQLPSPTHRLTDSPTHLSAPTHRLTDSPTHVSFSSSIPNPASSLGSSSLGRFSTWCPKAIAAIGHLPDTLADRCIVIRMQRKTHHEQTQRLRNLDTTALRQQCEAFVATHAHNIATAQPEIPKDLNDRAADIWEPLLVLADIAGGQWPQKARAAAIALSTRATESNPIGALLMDLLVYFARPQVDRAFTADIVEYLQHMGIRPWNENLRKPVTDLWLAQQLRPYGIRPKTFRIHGVQAKGYLQADMLEAFRRYIPKSEIDRIHEEYQTSQADKTDITARTTNSPVRANAPIPSSN